MNMDKNVNDSGIVSFIRQVAAMKRRQMNPHPAADIGPHNGRRDETVAHPPYRCCADASPDPDVGIRRIAEILVARNSQIIISHSVDASF